MMNQSGGWRFDAAAMDAAAMDARLRARLHPLEFLALCVAVAMAGIALWLHTLNTAALSDFVNYRNAGGGVYDYYYYAYWLVPFLSVLHGMPFYLAAGVWLALNITGLWIAARLLGGRPARTLLTYPMLYLLYYGQIGGILAGGLALAWWGLAHRRWGWAGLGFLIAAAKFQSGLIFAGLLWLFAPLPWRDRFKALIVPLLAGLASLWLYPDWPVQWMHRLQTNPANDFGSLSLLSWSGGWILLLLVPPLLLRQLPSERRFVALACAIPLCLPYFQQADLVVLFVFPLGWLPALGNLGFLFIPFGWLALKILALVPIVGYTAALWPPVARVLRIHWAETH